MVIVKVTTETRASWPVAAINFGQHFVASCLDRGGTALT